MLLSHDMPDIENSNGQLFRADLECTYENKYEDTVSDYTPRRLCN